MKFLMTLLMALMFATPTLAHGDDHEGGMVIDGVWARKTSRMVSAAVYLTIRNDSHQMDELVAAHTDAAENTMIHRSYEEGGMMRMDHVMSVPIKPGESFEFKPGGYHVMMMGLKAPLEKGEVFPLTLTFKKAGDVQVIVEVTGMMGPK